jgi:hypothetical protein
LAPKTTETRLKDRMSQGATSGRAVNRLCLTLIRKAFGVWGIGGRIRCNLIGG